MSSTSLLYNLTSNIEYSIIIPKCTREANQTTERGYQKKKLINMALLENKKKLKLAHHL